MNTRVHLTWLAFCKWSTGEPGCEGDLARSFLHQAAVCDTGGQTLSVCELAAVLQLLLCCGAACEHLHAHIRPLIRVI